MEAMAKVKFVRVSPIRARLIAKEMQGRSADEALGLLKLMPSRTAKVVAKVIKSSAANAENNFQMLPAALTIKNIMVDSGPTMKRSRAQARGRVSPILKHTSHITVVVEEKE